MLKILKRTLPQISEIYWSNNLVSKRFAGHSKWQNIRHTKGSKDAERSLMFTKLGRQMKAAVQEGGSADPNNNLKLEQIIEQAKRVNMPVATLQNILKSCQADKSQSKTYLLEIKGPGSCFILCEVFTSQLHHLKQTIASVLRKHNSKFSDGSVTHLFEEKGIVEAEMENVSKPEEILEKATEDAIVAGAEDVILVEENILQFICGKTNLKPVTKALEINYKLTSSSVEFIPLKYQNLQENEQELCFKLLEKLENMPEVVKMADNVA